MKTLLRYWPIVTFALGLAGTGAWQVHLHLLDDFNRDEAIRVLKTIAVQEHPAYWPMLFPGSKP